MLDLGTGDGPRGDRVVSPARVLVAVVTVAIVGLLVGILVGGYVLAPGSPDSEEFRTETAVQEDQIVHAFAPQIDGTHEYRVSFRILQEDTEIQRVDDEPYELAADDPLVVVIEDRDPAATYRVDVTIRNAADEVVYDATLFVTGSGSGSG